MNKIPFIVAVALAAFAVPSSGFSEEAWFDTGIKDYESWPVDGTDKEVSGVGVWRGTRGAALGGGQGARTLLVSTPIQTNLSFATESSQSISSEPTTIHMTAKLSFYEMGDYLPTPDADAKGALTIAKVDKSGTAAYFAFAKDPAGETNVWVRLYGVEPTPEAMADIAVDFKAEDGINLIRYTVDGVVLRDKAANEWLPVVFDCEEPEQVSTVVCSGVGELASLAGSTEQEIARIALTVPAIEHVSVKSVTANGLPVECDGEVWPVPRGSGVIVRFAPEDGYVLTTTSMKFKAGTEAMELPASGRPVAVEMSSCVSINEIMASNGTSLMTEKGFSGIDWIEICNSGECDVDLTGCYLGNDPTKAVKKWGDFEIKGGCVVPAGGYKIIWCDGDGLCTDWAEDEAHVSCNISTTAGKHTVFLASTANPDGVVQKIAMPGTIKDVSYGLGHIERTLFAVGDSAKYTVGDGAPTDVRGPVGMSVTPVNFTVTSYKSTAAVDSLEKANAVVVDSSKWARDPLVTANVETIAYRGGSASVNFAQSLYSPFPDGIGDTVIVVEGTVTVPRSGIWTFAVASDDGFRLELSNPSGLYSMEETQVRDYAITDSAFSLEAGSYALKLVYFDRDNDAAVDVSVAEGDFTMEGKTFNTTDFTLVGAANSPLQHGGAMAGALGADVAAEMLGKTDKLAWSGCFNLPELPEEQDRVLLKLRHSDAVAITVNGAVLASAGGKATIREALEESVVEIGHGLLVAGENEIGIVTTNDAVDNGDLFLSVQVSVVNGNGGLCFFREPTPGAANTTHGYGAMTPEVAFSVLHGYKTEPFTLKLSCAAAPYSPIYYTLDGSSPTVGSTLYTGQISVSKTTCIRAAVPQDNTILQKDCAATYIFLDDVLAQPQHVPPAGFPEHETVNGHAFRYGMDSRVINGPDREHLLRGFTNSIATLSVVIDPKNLFDKAHGIYVNPSGDGKDWERQTMIEQFNPVGDTKGFSVPAGIRIRGANSRQPGFAKHAFRFFFRSEYGMGSLEYPLFEGEGASEFDKVDLRCSQNYSWANEHDSQETFIHECFSRDSQGAMGELYTRSRYYNLFINGVYWGLYMTQERGGEDFAETYNGGAADNYDVIKTSRSGNSYVTGVSEGQRDAWDELRNMAIEGFDGEHADNYYKAMGRNPDGSRNSAYPVLLNPTNLMTFIISVHYACDGDSPNAAWGGHPNNLYAIRDRVDTGNSRHDGFFFLRHDAEHSLGLKSGYAATYSQYDSDPTEYGVTGNMAFSNFNPAELHFRLCRNPEYRRTFADVFYKHCLKVGGAMTAPLAKARFEKRMAEIDDAIVCECARWSTDIDARNRDQWLNVCRNNCIAGFIEKRMPVMLSQYRAKGWYPSIDAATAVDASDAPVADGTQIGPEEPLYLTGGEQGKVFYTTDGSDPCRADGTVSPNASEYEGALTVPPEGLTVAMRVLSQSGEWSALDTVSVRGSMPRSTPAEALRVAAVMSSAPGGDADDFLVLTNVTEGAVSLENVKLVAWNAKKKSEADPSLTLVFDVSTELAPGASLTLTAADFGGGKLTNSDVGIRLYDVSTAAPVLFQDVFVSADWFGGICDEKGAYFVAKEFGAEVKDISQWRPSETWVERNLRFYEIEGIPATDNDGADEYFVVTNLSVTTELDLAGCKVFIGKKGDMTDPTKKGDDEAKCKLTVSNVTVAANSVYKFKQPDWAWNKITDGELILKVYDADGTLVQYSEIKQKDFSGYAAGQKALRATAFGRETASSDWIEVDLPQSGSKVEGDGFLFYLAGEFSEPAVIAPTGTSCQVVLDGATVPGLTFTGEGEFTILASNENAVASLSAGAATVNVEGDGVVRLTGLGTLATVSNLYVKSGTFAVKSTGVPVTKTPVVNVLGSVKQTGGTIDIDLDVATDDQIYGIYVANKDMDAKFSGGTFNAKVGGTKSAAIYGNKGSVNPGFSGDVAVTAVLTGPAARFVNAEGKIMISGGTFDVSMPEDYSSLTNARVFKAGTEAKAKAIEISGGTFTVSAPADGSEIFSVDGTMTVSGGVFSLEAADDCLSATGDITITDGIVHATSTAGDAIDSNGNVTISGGKVFAFTCSPDHDAIDVDPILTESTSDTHEITILDGATVVAVGGNQEYFHKPDAKTTATCFAEKGLSSSKKYVELTGVLQGDNAKTTTVLSVNWNKRHADTFTLIAAMPGYDGTGYDVTNDKPTDVYENAYKLDDNVSGVFLRDTVEELVQTVEPGLVIEVTAADAEAAKAGVVLKVTVPEVDEMPVVDEETYKGYFVLTAKPVGGKDGIYSVEAVLNEAIVKPVIEVTDDIEVPFALGETSGEVSVKTLPGLWYSLVRGAEVNEIDTVRDCKLATGKTVSLVDAEILPVKAFYCVQVSFDEQEVR